MLQDAGAPTEPEQIGITRARLRQSYWQAFCIRRRFTVLDLAVRTGLLDTCLDEIFGPAGSVAGAANWTRGGGVKVMPDLTAQPAAQPDAVSGVA